MWYFLDQFVSGDDVDAIALEVFNELNRLSEAEKKQDIKNEQADWTKTKRELLLYLIKNYTSNVFLHKLTGFLLSTSNEIPTYIRIHNAAIIQTNVCLGHVVNFSS